MTIKHLVFSGGGPSMFQTLGCLQHLSESAYLELDKIETVYGTSAGAMVAVLVCLKYDWQTIRDYIIGRPWQDLFSVKVQGIFDAYTKKGIFDQSTIEKAFRPLFDAKDISMKITLSEFYAYSGIEMHFFSFEINEFKMVDVSYKSHPSLHLMTALHMTCSIPILMTPVCLDGKCYIDGGIICNYPLKYCLDTGKPEDEVLGFKNQYDDITNHIHSESTILDFILCFLFKVIQSMSVDRIQPSIKYEVLCCTNFLSIETIRTAMSSMDTRRSLYQSGIDAAIKYLTASDEPDITETISVGSALPVGSEGALSVGSALTVGSEGSLPVGSALKDGVEELC
jgi:predicted acylesterase/phospholipase RssA